jgi:hypothetical protein
MQHAQVKTNIGIISSFCSLILISLIVIHGLVHTRMPKNTLIVNYYQRTKKFCISLVFALKFEVYLKYVYLISNNMLLMVST